jgi:hypothetical protein
MEKHEALPATVTKEANKRENKFIIMLITF